METCAKTAALLDARDGASTGAGLAGSEMLAIDDAFQRRLMAFYALWNPQKLPSVPKLARKYAGHQEQLWAELYKKYQPPPSGEAGAPSPPPGHEAGSAQWQVK